jgi:hypothetical protein
MSENAYLLPDSRGSDSGGVDYSALLKQLEAATPFELYRLQSALNRMLGDPLRIEQVKEMIRVGDEVEYFEPAENREVKAIVLKCNRTRVVVKRLDNAESWEVLYCSINVAGVSSTIHERTSRGMGRNEVRIGDRVSFIDRNNRELFGTVKRLNQKTVTLVCDGDHDGQWRVAYSFLRPVLDADAAELPPHVIPAISFKPSSPAK